MNKKESLTNIIPLTCKGYKDIRFSFDLPNVYFEKVPLPSCPRNLIFEIRINQILKQIYLIIQMLSV